MGWSVLVPVRAGGKTRLKAPGDWTSACALDTLAAIRSCSLVDSVAVIGDLETDVEVKPDLGSGLNQELVRAAKEAQRPLAMILGDLPALKANDLDIILESALHWERAMVTDRSGLGTTMITTTVDEITPRFGIDSAQLHRASGFVELDAPIRARTDVDTYDDLLVAAQLGLGAHTSQLFTSLGK